MSYELLVLAGHPALEQAARRRSLIAHAAWQVPGARHVVTHETPHAVVALVETTPTGGGAGAIDIDVSTGTATAVVAMGSSGLQAAREGRGHEVGSEAAHALAAVAANGQVSLAVDGMRCLPLYWGMSGSGLAASTHLATLVSLGVDPHPDTTGALEYLVMHHPLQDRTIIGGARVLPAGGSMTWRPGDGPFVAERPLFVPRDAIGTDDAVLAAFREVWSDVVADLLRRTSDRRVALGLSGGLDSRAIASTGVDQGTRLTTYTYGSAGTRESAVAAAIARRLDLPHLVIPVPDDRLLRSAPQTLELLDGVHSPTEMYELWFADLLRSFADVIVNGHAGGPVWGDEKASGLLDAHLVVARLSQRYSAAAAAVAPFLGATPTEVAGSLRSSLVDSMRPWDFSARGDTVTFWGVANRQQRWGNALITALRRAGLSTETPFFDSRLLTLLSAVTDQQRKNGRLYLQIHKQVFARTADIPRSDDGNQPRNIDHIYWSGESPMLRQLAGLARHHPVSAGRRGGRRALSVAAATVRARTPLTVPADVLESRAAVFTPDLWVRQRPAYAGRLAELLEDGIDGCPLLDDQAIERMSAQVRRGTSSTPVAVLGRVAALGAWFTDYRQRRDAARAVGGLR